MKRFFNARLAEQDGLHHVAIPTDGGRSRQFPVVDGILAVPDDLAGRVVGSEWQPYRGQRPLPEGHEEALAELKGADAVERRAAKAGAK